MPYLPGTQSRHKGPLLFSLQVTWKNYHFLVCYLIPLKDHFQRIWCLGWSPWICPFLKSQQRESHTKDIRVVEPGVGSLAACFPVKASTTFTLLRKSAQNHEHTPVSSTSSPPKASHCLNFGFLSSSKEQVSQNTTLTEVISETWLALGPNKTLGTWRKTFVFRAKHCVTTGTCLRFGLVFEFGLEGSGGSRGDHPAHKELTTWYVRNIKQIRHTQALSSSIPV